MSAPSSLFSRHPWLLGALVGFVLLALCGGTAALGAGSYLLWRAQSARVAAEQEGARAPERAPEQAPATAPAGRLVIVTPDGQLQTMNPDGSEPRLLVVPGWRLQFPAWSPAGGAIAAPGMAGEQAGVWVVKDAEDARATAIYRSREHAPIYLYWSPDSHWISFLATEQPGLGLWLAGASGAEPARKLETGQPFYWDWTQTSDHLLIHSGGRAPNGLITFLDLAGQSTAGDMAPPGPFQAPGISASGRYIAFAENGAAGASAVIIEDMAHAGQRQSARHDGFAALSWSPVADQLAFISPPRRAPHFYGPLRLFDARTGAIRTLSDRIAVAFFWSPDGRTIAYLTPAEAGSGARRDPTLQPAAHRPQAERVLLDLWLVEVARGTERRLATFQPADLFASQFLPFFDQYALSHCLWSPASDALVFPVQEDSGSERVFVFPTDGALPRPVAEGSAGFWSRQ